MDLAQPGSSCCTDATCCIAAVHNTAKRANESGFAGVTQQSDSSNVNSMSPHQWQSNAEQVQCTLKHLYSSAAKQAHDLHPNSHTLSHRSVSAEMTLQHTDVK